MIRKLSVALIIGLTAACAAPEADEATTSSVSNLRDTETRRRGSSEDPLTSVPSDCKTGEHIWVRSCHEGPEGRAKRTCQYMCTNGDAIEIRCGAFGASCDEEPGVPNGSDRGTPDAPLDSIPPDCKTSEFIWMKSCQDGPQGPADRTCRYMCLGDGEAVKDPSSCGAFGKPYPNRKSCY